MSQSIASGPRHHILRVRRETRRRLVSVAATERITPNMLRIRFTSPELHDFESLAPDDHVKLFVPNPTGGEPNRRDYTPRAFDAALGTLTIDFALHDSGPATAWALGAGVGDRIEIGGPRGSILVADDFDWYLLIGDETALPAIGRWVESRRPGVPVKTIAVIDGDADRQDFATRADWDATWVVRSGGQGGDAALLRAAVAVCGPLPPGDGYIWIAAEANVARVLRTYVSETMGHPKVWIKAAGYWMKGQADTHVSLDD